MMDQQLYSRIEAERQEVERLIYERDHILDEIKDIERELQEINTRINDLDKITILYKETSKFARDQSRKDIEKIVTACLKIVFGEEIKFKIELKDYRNRPGAEFYVVDTFHGHEHMYKAEQSRGGGIVDIISLSLRIAFLLRSSYDSKNGNNGPLILDEPCKHLSEEYIYNISEFLKKVSEQYSLQIILISHNNHIASISDNSYRVHKEDYKSIVESL